MIGSGGTIGAMFSLDRASPLPLAAQAEAGLRELIERGQLVAGARLPSIRRLAAQLEVSPNTVIVAYDRLVADGRVHARGKAGYYVSEASAGGGVVDDSPLEAGEEQDPLWLAQQSYEQRPGLLQASSGALPLAWIEDVVPLSLVQRALAKTPGGLAARCPPQGLPALRERLAMQMRAQGIAVDASRVLTVAGGTQAIDLICRAFLQPGDAVVVEDPGYFLLFGRLRQAGVRVIAVDRRPDGVDLDQLEAACAEHRPRVAFLQPVVHNPTGWGSSAANLHRVLRIAERHGVLIAEDDVHGPFVAGQPTRLAQLAALERVIHYSSFCKLLSPGLRLGYLAADPQLLKPLLREKIYAVLATSPVAEWVLLEVLASGRLRKHAERVQARLAAARLAAARNLRQAGIVFDHVADDGLFLWGRVPDGTDIEGLVKDAYRNGIVLARGATFRADAQAAAGDPHIRFNAGISQQARLADYLGERLRAVALAGDLRAVALAGNALARMAAPAGAG